MKLAIPNLFLCVIGKIKLGKEESWLFCCCQRHNDNVNRDWPEGQMDRHVFGAKIYGASNVDSKCAVNWIIYEKSIKRHKSKSLLIGRQYYRKVLIRRHVATIEKRGSQ